jgi:hypothetical protein
MSRSSTTMVEPARSTKPAPLRLPGYTRTVQAATGRLTQAVLERALEVRARGQPADPGHERTLAFIKNSAHPSTDRCHRFRDRRFGVARHHEDVAGATRPIGRISRAGRSSGSRGRARCFQRAALEGSAACQRDGVSAGLAQDCHFLAVCGHDAHRPRDRAGLAPWHGITYLRNNAMGRGRPTEGFFNANT